ncbi:MAG TPA: hypothetical protein VEK84_05605 [Terriglobales bacterium]|nr:hypothetical protein [Terriglobales bacterium]
MNRKPLLVVTVLALAIVASAAAVPKLLQFNAMQPVKGPFVGTLHPIRGIPGAGKIWKIGSAKAELDTAGKLQITVTGLVLNDPTTGGANGTNPLPTFRAALSCQSINALGNPSVVNLRTGNFAATPAGNAVIEQTLVLHKPCFAPMVFVTTPTGAWLAISGF